MRRVVILGTGLLAVGAAFCAGRATAHKLKYPWAGELLNRPCGKTELEWRCATKSLRKDADQALTKVFTLRSLVAEIKPKGVIVCADITRRPGAVVGPGHRGWNPALREACAAAFRQGRLRFGDGLGPDKPFTYWPGMAVLLSVDGTPAMKGVDGKYQAHRGRPGVGHRRTGNHPDPDSCRRRPPPRPGRQACAATQALHAGRPEEAIAMEGPSPERKSRPPGADKRGLECRYCGCTHFRVIYTRRGWGGKLIRRREPVRRSLREGGCRHCGKRMTTWEKPIGG